MFAYLLVCEQANSKQICGSISMKFTESTVVVNKQTMPFTSCARYHTTCEVQPANNFGQTRFLMPLIDNSAVRYYYK